LAEVQKSLATKNVQATWDLLASYGDTYAKAAAVGIKDPTSYYGQMIRNAWHAADADFSKFNVVALQHQKNYVGIIKANFADKGVATLPKTNEIESSYYQALDRNHVSPFTAIDLLLSKISSKTSTPNWHDPAFGFGMDIEPDRKGPPSEEAKRLTLADASGRLTRILAFTVDSQWQWNGAQARTYLPQIKYASDAILKADAKLHGTSSIIFSTSGGFKIYNNTNTHTFVMFDKGMNGHAWINGKWVDISPKNWRLDPDQSEGQRNSGTDASGALVRPGEIYQYKDPATGEWKRANLPGDTTRKFALSEGEAPFHG
jgi:hypothetical protein